MDDTTDTGTPQTTKGDGDDRRGTVDPAKNPHPVNPPTDDEAVEKGREAMDRVKPY